MGIIRMVLAGLHTRTEASTVSPVFHEADGWFDGKQMNRQTHEASTGYGELSSSSSYTQRH